MRQTWRNLTFLHWRYEAENIQRTLPPQLTLDTFEGAWTGLAPFVLAGVQPFGLRLCRGSLSFPKQMFAPTCWGPDGKPGVWFFTLEADRLIGVLAARAWYKLPYRWADMRVTAGDRLVEYHSRRHRMFGKGSTDLAIEVGDKLNTQDFDHFLTARFRLYAVHKSHVGFCEVDHDPWPLREGRGFA